jgi:uncharacterized membrane protein YphA (DoxX/SURF4 family)
MRVVDVGARLGLAVVWLVAGGIKLFDPGQSYLAVRAYSVLPDALVRPVAVGLPVAEVLLGLFLLLGLRTRLAAMVSAGVLVLFIAAVAQSWARGLTIDCGCFGGGGQVAPGETQYFWEIARDTGFLALASWLVIRPRTWLTLDGWKDRNAAEPGRAGGHHQSETRQEA